MLMRSAFRIARTQFCIALRSAKAWIAVFAGFLITATAAREFIEASWQLGYPLQILEPFLVLIHDRLMIVFVAIAVAFVLSDAPCRNAATPYLIFKTGRVSWMLGNAFYMMGVCVIFIGLMLLFNIVLCAPFAFPQDLWSPIGRLLGAEQTMYHLSSYRSIESAILNAFSPYQAVGVQAMLLILYCFCVCGVMLLFNAVLRGNMGFAFAMMFHGLMLVMFMDGHPIGALLSLFTHACLITHVGDSIPMGQSLLFFFGFAFCAYGASVVLSRRMDIE